MQGVIKFFKEFGLAILYLGLASGVMLLVAALLFYLQPLDFISESAVFPRNPHGPGFQMAMRLWKPGLVLALGAVILIKVIGKIKAWIKSRHPQPDHEPVEEGKQGDAAQP